MKVFYTHNSPYARRARLAARASGLGVAEVDVAPLRRPDQPLLEKGPGGKVPGFETETGGFLCETLLITAYLNEKSGGKLLGADADAARELEGLGSLTPDSIFGRSAESRREDREPSPSYMENEGARTVRCYDALEAELAGQAPTLNLGTIAAVSALGYADWRMPGDDWRAGRPGLAKWFDDMHTLTDVAETKPNF